MPDLAAPGFGAVPVTEGSKAVGMVTDRDIVIRVVAERGSLDGPVSAVMSENVETCREDDDLADAAARMGARQIRRLVVLNSGGRLAGILSLGDIAADCDAKAVGRTLEEVSENSSRALTLKGGVATWRIADAARPHYEALAAHRLTVSSSA